MRGILPGMTSTKSRFRSTLFRAVAYLAWCIGLTELLSRWVARWPGLIALCYHRIVPKNGHLGNGYRGNTTSLARFHSHIKYLKQRYGFEDIEVIADYLRTRRPLPSNHILITFDDGYRDVYQYGVAVLKKEKVPATFFISTEIFDRDFLLPADRFAGYARNSENPDERLYLNMSEVGALASMGFSVGSHTRTHPELGNQPLKEQQREIRESKGILERILDRSVCFFSYPIGTISPGTPTLVKKAGYLLAFSNRIGCVTHEMDRFLLPRVSACDYSVPPLAMKIVLVKLWHRLNSAWKRYGKQP